MGRWPVDWYGFLYTPTKPVGKLTQDYLNRVVKELYESAESGISVERKVEMSMDWEAMARSALKNLGVPRSKKHVNYMAAVIQQNWCNGFSDGCRSEKERFEREHPAAERQKVASESARAIAQTLDAMTHAVMALRDVVKEVR
jgi:hypothetical protein